VTLTADPNAYPPVGMSRERAAHHIGVSTHLFDEMVADRRMPKPRQIGRRVVWDRREVEMAFAELPHQGQRGYFDKAS
jgi:predicted DNA-binding transcriptional regulator AlpA